MKSMLDHVQLSMMTNHVADVKNNIFCTLQSLQFHIRHQWFLSQQPLQR